MVVKLDLRIPGKETRKEIETGYRHLLVFAAAALFLFTMIIILGLGTWKFYSLSNEKKDLARMAAAEMQKLQIMDNELKRVVKENDLTEDKLDYMLGDIPSIELLSALSAILPDGVALERVNITQDKALFKGVAHNEKSILLFTDNIASSDLTLSVSLPVITPAVRNGIKVRDFTIECELKPLYRILSVEMASKLKSDDILAGTGL